MEVKVLNSIRFASLSANYELDTNVNLKATNRASYHGLDLTLDECLSAVKDTSINNYSSFYLSNDYDYKDVLSLDKLALPSNYTFTSYIRLNNDSENTYLASKPAPKEGLTSLYYTSTLDKNAFFEINFLDDLNCKIKHTEGGITRYLTYNYLTTNLSMLTGTDTVQQFDLNTFQYVYDASSDFITFTKKIFDAPHVLTYSSLSTLTLEPSDNNARIFPFLTTQTFKLRENPTTINDLLSTSNYVYKKTLDDRELKVSLDESVYSFNSNFLYNAEYYNINPYKNNNLYVNILNLKNQKTAKNTQSQGGVFLNQPAFKHRYYEDLYTGVNQIKGNYNIGLGYSSYTLAKTLKKDNLNYLKMSTTINKEEIQKFSKLSEEWWDVNGKFKPLHMFNPIRIEYITENIKKHLKIKKDKVNSLEGLKILDIGCGGGLISEPMTRLGAKVTGIDASKKNINIAKTHSMESGLEINYVNTSPEKLEDFETYDVILNLEIVEHVDNVDLYIKSCQKLLNKNGLMFTATLNRSFTSYIKAIIGAEYILRWLPIGTHDWNKFLKPEELENYLTKEKLITQDICGLTFNPFTKRWKKSSDLSVNYIICSLKN